MNTVIDGTTVVGCFRSERPPGRNACGPPRPAETGRPPPSTTDFPHRPLPAADAAPPIHCRQIPMPKTQAQTRLKRRRRSKGTKRSHTTRLIKNIGATIRELRLKKKWSLDVMGGQLTGLGRSHLGDIELGKIDASISTLDKIARAFDITVSQLFGKIKG